MPKSGHEITNLHTFFYFNRLFKEMDAFRTRNILGKMVKTQTVLIIERGLVVFSHPSFRLYRTYDRKFLKGIQTVLLIEQYL